MTFRRSIVGISISLILAVAAPARVVASHPAQAVQAKELILQTAEVPRFQVAESHIVTNEQLAHANKVGVSIFTREGRVTGYRIVYHRSTTSGIATITNTDAIYSSAAGAHRAYTEYATGVLKSFIRAQSAHVGDESLIFSHSQPIRGTMAIEAAIAFRAGQYRAYVAVAGTEGPTVIPQLVAYAQLVFKHMQRAGISAR